MAMIDPVTGATCGSLLGGRLLAALFITGAAWLGVSHGMRSSVDEGTECVLAEEAIDVELRQLDEQEDDDWRDDSISAPTSVRDDDLCDADQDNTDEEGSSGVWTL